MSANNHFDPKIFLSMYNDLRYYFTLLITLKIHVGYQTEFLTSFDILHT